MSRRRKSTDTTPFDTLRLEGSLFVPELLERAASGEATFQKETDYAIPKGLKLHDEYGRAFRIATASWQSFEPQTARADLDAAAVTRAFAVDFLRQCLGYTDLTICPAPLDANGRSEAPIQHSKSNIQNSPARGFPVTAMALGGRLPVIISPHSLGLDDPDPRFAIIGSGSRKKSAHQLAQEFLNASSDSLWAIVTNGRTLRLLRDADTLTRPNFLEFDLETILRDDQHRYADFSALWRILHASRASSSHCSPITDHSALSSCIWEKWKSEGHAQGLRVRDGLRDGVTEAILILGRGFLTHPDNTALRQRLHDGTLTLDDYFQQFFRLIYRCLFLFCTEERDLLHPPAPADSSDIQNSKSNIQHSAARLAYATGYSLRRFRKRSLRQSAHDPHGDLWQSVRIVFRSLAHGQEKLALPALGGLFAETQCPDLDTASLSNRDLLSAMRELRWFFDRKTGKRSAIDYRNMGTEELGSVYESLLELVPTIDLPARTFGFVGITDAGSTSGNARKTTGSYYTADPLVMELIKSALEPVIRQRLADARELAAAPWATVAARIATDSVQRTYVHAWLVKQSALPADATPETIGRAWDAIPAAARANPLCAEALLHLTVCDPSCGSGHFLLAAARRLAETLAELRSADGAVRPDDYRHALREVASRCLYGVDINPMAVELCRVALWLETVDPGKPLGFLNHHIRHGNSLLGTTPDLIAAGLPDETFTAIEGDDKPACAELKKRNKAERTGFGPLFAEEEDSIREKLRQAATSIEAMDDSQPAALQQKEAAFLTNETATEYRHAKLLADLWCAAFVIKKRSAGVPPAESQGHSVPLTENLPTECRPASADNMSALPDLFGQPVPASKPTAKPKSSSSSSFGIRHSAFGITTGTLRDFVQGKPLPKDLESEVTQLAEQYHFFHWHIAFPQVFERGGFDCILGNPPWEKINLKDEEYFAGSHPQIAEATSKAARKSLIEDLKRQEPASYAKYLNAQEMHDRTSVFFRTSGSYPLTGMSRINLYSVFCETGLRLLSKRGRLGMVLASGIVTDDNNKDLFATLINDGRLIHAWDFENSLGIFPGVHRSFKFLLLCAGGPETKQQQADFAFFLTDVQHILEPERHFTLTGDELALLNPNTRTCPSFRNRSEAELTKLIYRNVPAWELHQKTKIWPGVPKTPFNMSNDSGLFVETSKLPEIGNLALSLSPLYESKFIFQFNHRFATFSEKSTDGTADFDSKELQDPSCSVKSRYWLPQDILTERFPGRWFFGYRMITNATNERAAVAAIIPERPCAHSLSIVEDLDATGALVLLGCVNSFAYDYAARQKIAGMNFSHWIWRQLPIISDQQIDAKILWLSGSHSLRDWLLPRVLELTYTAWDLEAFAADCGWPGPPFRWDEDRRFLLRCELDAAFFHLYLGSEDEWGKESGGENGTTSSIQHSKSNIQNSSALTRAFPTPRHAVSYIMDTFPIVKRKDEAKHGTYRTKETILQIYDALAESIASGLPYQTLLDPPPADPACCHPPRPLIPTSH
jgi:hypothetical protein